jgi:hypothetical protein
VFHELGIQRERRHGGVLNGGNCQQLALKCAEVAKVLHPRTLRGVHDDPLVIRTRRMGNRPLADALEQLLRSILELHQLFMSTRPLCEHELASFPGMVRAHMELWRRHFPSKTTTHKGHWLAIHFNEFLTNYHSVSHAHAHTTTVHTKDIFRF